jgi:hypothetical protein
MNRRKISQAQWFAALHEREAGWGNEMLARLLAGADHDRELGQALARMLIEHQLLVQDVIRDTRSRRPPLGCETAHERLAACRRAHRETQLLLLGLSDAAWELPIESADGAPWPVLRHGEMLWLALRDLVDHLEACARAAGESLAEPHRTSA